MKLRKLKRKLRTALAKSIDDEISLVCLTSEPKDVRPKAAGSYCPLVDGFCKTENCGSCVVLQNHAPRHIWLCTKCSDAEIYTMHPFWEDTPCAICGIDVGVMVCAKIKKKRR